MRGLRAISSFSVRLMASTIVSGLPSGCGRRVERRRSRVDVRREDIARGGVLGRSGGLERFLRGFVDLAIDVGAEFGEFVDGRQVVVDQRARRTADRIAARFGLAFGRRLVELFIVRQRV